MRICHRQRYPKKKPREDVNHEREQKMGEQTELKRILKTLTDEVESLRASLDLLSQHAVVAVELGQEAKNQAMQKHSESFDKRRKAIEGL